MSLKLGSPQTSQFSIGTSECRIGPLSLAGKLPQANTIGLIDDATIAVDVTTVELKGLFPQVTVDMATTANTGSIKIKSREFSRRNLDLILGNGIESVPTTADVKTTLSATADVAAAATSITLATGTGSLFSVGDIITIYPDGAPQDVTVTKIASIATDTITLVTGFGTLAAYPALANAGVINYNVFKSMGVAAGAVTKTNYFTVQLIKPMNSSGRPVVWNAWKCASSGSMSESNSATEYGTLEMEFKILQPTFADLATGGSLNAVAAWVASYPLGARFGGADI